MKKIILAAALCVHTLVHAGTGRPDLVVPLIPSALLDGANSVVRLSETEVSVSSASEVEYDIHEVITILNESAAGNLTQAYAYNDFCKITDFTCFIYDKDGKLMNKHTLKDMQDYAAFDGFSLFNSARFKHIQTNGGLYPITVDRHLHLKYKGILDLRDWYFQDEYQSVEHATLTLETPADLDIHYKCYNSDLKPSIKVEKNKIYTWTVQDMKPFKIPSASYSRQYFLPHVDLSPSHFAIESYRGSWDSWTASGATMADMWRSKRDLPPAVVAEIKNMVKDAHTDKEKIDILYSYMQKNFHYVSVQIGIGGYVPFSAETVHSAKYGDCKALSNYMCAILGVAGVRSHPVLINAGSDEHAIDTAFPSNHFNHAILCAEADGQPLWLECTSTSMPAGELGTFTENRYGLMIGDSSGMIVHTPSSDASLNTFDIRHEVTQLSGTRGHISGCLSLGGEYRHAAKPSLLQGTDKERTNFVYTSEHIRHTDGSTLSGARDSLGHISVDITGNSENIFDFNTGGKQFLPSTFISTWYRNVSAENDRKENLLMGFPSTKNEKLIYHLDSAGTVSIPGDFDLDNALVYFHRKSDKAPGNTVTITTELRIKQNIIQPGQVALLKESLQKVNKCLQQKVILETK